MAKKKSRKDEYKSQSVTTNANKVKKLKKHLENNPNIDAITRKEIEDKIRSLNR